MGKNYRDYKERKTKSTKELQNKLNVEDKQTDERERCVGQ
jgi:hypothetical protein